MIRMGLTLATRRPAIIFNSVQHPGKHDTQMCSEEAGLPVPSRSISEIMTTADSAEDTPGLPLAIKPCVELLPAAVMIADITGFTARAWTVVAGSFPMPACLIILSLLMTGQHSSSHLLASNSHVKCSASSSSHAMRHMSNTFFIEQIINKMSWACGAVTEALSTKGSAGVELLTKCMNRYFSQVAEAAECMPWQVVPAAICLAVWPCLVLAMACQIIF
jgi:hypothetical protein